MNEMHRAPGLPVAFVEKFQGEMVPSSGGSMQSRRGVLPQASTASDVVDAPCVKAA